YSESGFNIEISKKHFRFSECYAYKQISGKSVKEMDFCIFDDEKRELILVEIKNYIKIQNKSEFKTDKLTETLCLKVVDSLLMFCAGWLKTNWGNDFLICIPDTIKKYIQVNKINIFFFIKIPKSLETFMPIVQDDVNKKLEGKLDIFGIGRASFFFEKQKIESSVGIKIE
ncbi:hypothetical protein J7L68_03640, partial [bacterium]|nr:hypothetical protein [bacterium]